MLIVLLIKMWIAGIFDVNELKFHLPRTSCITLIRFTQNTIVGLINIKSICEMPPGVYCFSPWALTILVSLYQAALVVLCLEA